MVVESNPAPPATRGRRRKRVFFGSVHGFLPSHACSESPTIQPHSYPNVAYQENIQQLKGLCRTGVMQRRRSKSAES